LYYFFNDDEILNGSVVVGVVMTTVLRACIISFRYGTTLDSSIEKMYKGLLTEADISGEFMADGWLWANSKNLDREIKASMARNEIETKFFVYRIFNKVDKTYN
jgi:hypothetical protein